MTSNVIELRPTVQDITTETLDAVQEQLDKYIVFPHKESRDAVALWVAHAWVFRAFDATPRLSVRSAEPGSGKSRVLDVVSELVPSPMNAAYITPGVMWRKIEHGNPTIMLDEADTIFGMSGSASSHRELRGIINAGHRSNGSVPRCVGAESVHEFSVFAPVAIAGIGRLPETIATRSVEVVMRKRREGDPSVEQFRLRFAQAELAVVKKQLDGWAKAAFKPLTMMLPDLPVANRDADVWEPLVCIGVLAGGEWEDRARAACLRMVKESADKPVTPGVLLLAAIKEVFGADESLDTGTLMDRLYSMPESPYIKGLFGSRDLARMLHEFGIKSQTIRVNGDPVRGYKSEAFQPAWDINL